MKFLNNWPHRCRKIARMSAITGLMALLFLFSWSSPAQADDLGLVTAAQEYTKTVTEARSVFSDLASEAQGLLDQGLEDAKAVLTGLPDDLSQIEAAPDLAARTALQTELTAKQQSLKAFTQSFSAWLSKAELADKQYEKTVDMAEDAFKQALKASEASLKTQTHGSLTTLKQSLKQTSKLIGGLTDSTSKVAGGKGLFVPTQYEAQLDSLNKAFDDVKAAIAALGS
jgi:hypothetical protein